jgi:phage-related protein
VNFEAVILEEAEKFLLSLSPKMQAKIQRSINLLEEFGFDLTLPHSKKIQGAKELYELRIKLGSDICRLFYFHWKGKVFVILSGYVKKENKTNPNEIKKALKLIELVKEH